MILFIVLLLMVIVGGLSIQRHVFPTERQWEETRRAIYADEPTPGNPWFWPALLLCGLALLLATVGGA